MTRFAVPAGVLGLALLAAAFRLIDEGRTELALCDAAWQKGDAQAAIVHARGAARAYVPGADHVLGGYARLREMAETSERRGDASTALFAWRAVLSSATASRPFSACGETCAAAEAGIVRSSAASTSPRAPPSERRIAGERSAGDVVPRASWGAVIVVAAGLLLAAGHRLSRAFGRDGALVRSEVRTAAVMGALGVVAWILGLLFA